MSSHKQSILSALLANPKKLSNENEKDDLKNDSKDVSKSDSQSASKDVPSKSISKPSKEVAKPSKEVIIADGSKTYYSKIIDEQNKKIEYLENQLKEASNRNLIRLIQEYI